VFLPAEGSKKAANKVTKYKHTKHIAPIKASFRFNGVGLLSVELWFMAVPSL